MWWRDRTMGIRSIGRRLFFGHESTTKESINPWIGADAGNGFGAKRLLRSSIQLNSGGRSTHADAAVLDGVQVLTRYCKIESPYWFGFLSHYRDLGVKYVNVCVQSEDDFDAVIQSPTPDGLVVIGFRIASDLDPSSALSNFDLGLISGQAPFTLLVDCDEYFYALRPDLVLLDLFHTFPEVGQFYFPWLMCPVLSPRETDLHGFWGHIGKPVVHSSRMASIGNDHSFRVDDPSNDTRHCSAPAGLFGFVIIHYWSRTFRDCLLKTFNNRFKDSKSSDIDFALAKIRSGDLPVRLRLLAYLRSQAGFLPVPSMPVSNFRFDLEERLLRQCLCQDDESLCRTTFDSYCEKLMQERSRLPIYPSIALKSIVDQLPSPLIN